MLIAAAPLLAGCDASPGWFVSPGRDCKEVAVEAVLHFDAGDSRRIWGTDLETGRDLSVRPKPALGWRIDPGPPQRLVDRAGRIAVFDGDIFRQACFDASTNTFYIGPEDLPDPDRPPN